MAFVCSTTRVAISVTSRSCHGTLQAMRRTLLRAAPQGTDKLHDSRVQNDAVKCHYGAIEKSLHGEISLGCGYTQTQKLLAVFCRRSAPPMSRETPTPGTYYFLIHWSQYYAITAGIQFLPVVLFQACPVVVKCTISMSHIKSQSRSRSPTKIRTPPPCVWESIGRAVLSWETAMSQQKQHGGVRSQITQIRTAYV